MVNARSEDLWFLAPGLLHHFSNALFAAQGQLQLAALDLQRARPAQEALQRAQGALAVVRHLLPGGGGPVAVAAVVHGLSELLRVPLRDLGLRLVTTNVPFGVVADAGLLIPALLSAVRSLADAVPRGLGAALALTVTADEQTVALRWRIEPGPGSLPFGVDWNGLGATLAAGLPPGVVAEPVGGGDGVRLAVPAMTGTETADSDANLR